MRLNRKYRAVCIAGWMLLPHLLASECQAQVTLQQPVFSQFGLGTTVSVPTGGGAFLGGLNRAGEGRTSFGPFRPGTATGFYRDAQSVTTHVTIHDFEAMDRMLLEQAQGTVVARPTQLNGFAAHAYEQLSGSRSGRQRSTAGENQREHLAEAAGRGMSGNERLERSARALRLGEEALQRNRPIQARLHFQMAAREGSAVARQRLAEIAGTPVQTATTNPR